METAVGARSADFLAPQVIEPERKICEEFYALLRIWEFPRSLSTRFQPTIGSVHNPK